MIAKYIGGIIELTKDAMRLTFYFLKRPHYTAAVLFLIIGVFYLNGIPPQKISGFLAGKWQAFVENRKQTFKEDMQLISDHFKKEENEKKQEPVKKEETATETKSSYQRQAEEEAKWKQAFEEARKAVEITGDNVVEGVLTIVSANEVQLEKQKFLLPVQIHSGKASEAFERMKNRFDGKQAKCVPDKDNAAKAECFVGSLGVSEMLIDFGFADPI